MPLTKAVFEESLRLYPPAWGQPRESIQPDEIDGCAIPAKAIVTVNQYLTHRHPYFWEEPDQFKPERFLTAGAENRHRFAYFPFGGGPRICIGNTFAMLEGPLVLATIIQRFRAGLPGKGDLWLKALKGQEQNLLHQGQALGFNFISGQRPTPNKQGRIASTFEWGKKLTADDIKLLKGEAAFGEKLPDPDAGFTQADLKDTKKAEAVYKVIRERLETYRKERPGGYLVREAPAEEVKQLKILVGHLKEGQFVTKFRKTFTKGEMNDDLLIVPAKMGEAVDVSEHEEILPTSPP